MQILAIDVGMGTQDILLYDDEKRIENCYKMVLPSPTLRLAERVRSANGKEIFLTGRVMGGGHLTRAVKEHLRKGGHVYATPDVALTLNDNLDYVREMGVEVMDDLHLNDDPNAIGGEILQLGDLNLEELGSVFEVYGMRIPERVAVAVQDHGFAPHMSNRIKRFEIFKEVLKKGGRLDDFAYKSPPPEFNRMQAAAETIRISGRKPVVMDTGPAAITGAMLDLRAKEPAVAINLGNGHTIAAVVSEGRIISLFEHHTSKINAAKVDDYTKRLADGNLDFEEIFDDGGHGCYIHESIGFDKIKTILLTGPNREIMKESTLPVIYAVPFGDAMLTGCFGLVENVV
ncbi:pyruvate formate lyase-activating protein [Methanosarcinales archaeon]|nr:MAG: pyruvate formate lyase-activating protein [Methanosarcinales archaeon]